MNPVPTPAPQAPRFRLRPVAEPDLDALERMAQASAFAINSLPDDRDKLRLRIERSLQAFATEDDASGEELYLFVLEDASQGGRLVGTSGITARAGFRERFYSYRNEVVVRDAPLLGQSHRLHTLHLCHDLTGCTLLSSFFIEPDYEHTEAAQLLSRARLLFILAHPERFSDRIVAENPGLADHEGRSPFWDAVGRPFFNLDYPSAERLSGGRARSFIAELMPQAPLVVPLLPETAQWAIGQLHPVGELPFSILLDEGFEADTYVDVFDAGPTAEARLPLLHSIRSARQVQVLAPDAPFPMGAQALVSAQAQGPSLVVRAGRSHFAATWADTESALQNQALSVSHPAVQALGAAPGERLWVSPGRWSAGALPPPAQKVSA
jgi:arginine N-succinyltransferase